MEQKKLLIKYDWIINYIFESLEIFPHLSDKLLVLVTINYI